MKDKEVYQKIVEKQKWCQLCGSTQWLEIHHIYYRSEGGLTVEKNLIRLCEKDHKKVHTNKRKWQPFLLKIQYNKYGYFTKEEVTKCKDYFKVE